MSSRLPVVEMFPGTETKLRGQESSNFVASGTMPPQVYISTFNRMLCTGWPGPCLRQTMDKKWHSKGRMILWPTEAKHED